MPKFKYNICKKEYIFQGPDLGIRTNELRACQPIDGNICNELSEFTKWETFALTLYKWQTHCVFSRVQ